MHMKCPVCGTEMSEEIVQFKKPKLHQGRTYSVMEIIVFGWIYFLVEFLIWLYKWIAIIMWWMMKWIVLAPLWYHGKKIKRYTCPIDGTVIDKKVYIK